MNPPKTPTQKLLHPPAAEDEQCGSCDDHEHPGGGFGNGLELKLGSVELESTRIAISQIGVGEICGREARAYESAANKRGAVPIHQCECPCFCAAQEIKAEDRSTPFEKLAGSTRNPEKIRRVSCAQLKSYCIRRRRRTSSALPARTMSTPAEGSGIAWNSS